MEEWAKIFKALSDETRLKILGILFEKGFCVGALARHLGKSEASVSQHIRILRKAGILVGEKRNGYTFYELNRELAENIIVRINHIMEGMPQRKECCHYITGKHQFCEIYNNSPNNEEKSQFDF